MPGGDRHAKTEKPTPKRLREARDRGQVARSLDVTGWGSILLASYLLPWYLGLARGHILQITGQALTIVRTPSVPAAVAVLGDGLRTVLVVVLPLAAIAAGFAVVGSLAQTGRKFSLRAAAPKLSRLNPKGGIKRLFSFSTAQQLAKQLLKLIAISGIAYTLLGGLTRAMVGARPVSLLPILGLESSTILNFVHVLAFVGLAVGIGDFAFQKRRLNTSLKMTKNEVKDEAKAAEGDPHTKGLVKKRMYEISRSKMRAAVRQADVVVTNPTHYAVALQYNTARAAAPRVLAKGADNLALRIREEAAACEIPVVEDPPLARYLYAICDIDQQIPPEIYLAVARVLAFVYSLPELVRSAAVHHPAPSVVPTEPEALAGLSESQRRRIIDVLAGTGAR